MKKSIRHKNEKDLLALIEKELYIKKKYKLFKSIKNVKLKVDEKLIRTKKIEKKCYISPY